MFQIEKADVTQAKAKIAFVGPAGSGKTYTALVTAKELGQKILVIDTENKTSSKYANLFSPYDILPLQDYSLKTYIEALQYCEKHDYDVIIIDSLSHAWAGKGGALEQAEKAKSKYGGNKFAGWADVTPLQNQLVDTILTYPKHLIATMRMKIDYIITSDDRGKQQVQKVGLGVVQRDSFEYEFDVIGQMDVDHNLVVTKTRCFELDGFIAHKPDGQLGQIINNWLTTGQPLPPPELTYEPVEAKESPKPTNSKQKETSDPWPAKSGPVAVFCQAVKQSTPYYTSQWHLSNALQGGFGNLSDTQVFNAKLQEALEHASQKADEMAAKES